MNGRDTARAGGYISLSIVVAIVVVTALGIIGAYTQWFGLAVTAPARVQGANLQTGNIIQKQNYFYAVNQEYEAKLANVARFEKALATDTAAKADMDTLKADRDGIVANQQACTAIATDYNGQATNFNSGQFRSISLPSHLDPGACDK
ncbi:MAG: hypothetical protein JWM87_795 [Candidatus Eremiobacteraeota bacterium]|nr:hypothetical protein [Candidatus Eremiobacteraeota bacterium]